MSDQHGVDEGPSRRSSEGIPNMQDRSEGSSQNNGSKKSHQSGEEKPKEMETGKGKAKLDSTEAEPLLSPGIQKADVKDDRDAKNCKPDAGIMTGNDPYNYEEKYPEDKIYEELGPNARVWRTYVDESRNYDARIVRESRDTVDLLLVFAGLFSAVVTTFVSQTYQNLQADYGQVSASLLFEMVLIQRAIANGSSLDNIPASSLNPYTQFTPATTDVWVNGLWFTSLSLSLATALVAVLVKQWLHHYLALPSGTPRERSHVRQYRYGGFRKWHVLVIVGLLPVLMHLALGIFFIGLTVFLVPLQPSFSWVIGIGTVVAYATYMITIFLPIRYPQCPYRTPLPDLVYFLYHYIKQDLFPKHVRPLSMKESQRHFFISEAHRVKISSLDYLERGVVQDESATLSVEALHWLFSSSSNPTVHSIVIQSIGGLPLSAMDAVGKVFKEDLPIREAQYALLEGSMQKLGGFALKPLPGMESRVKRLLRFELFIPYLVAYSDSSRLHFSAVDDDEELTAIVQSLISIDGSRFRRSPSTSNAFFQQIIFSDPLELPPVIWLGLMRTAKDDGAFTLIDNEEAHAFFLRLCGDFFPWVTPMPSGLPTCVRFETAVQYFPQEFIANMLGMISSHDKSTFDDRFSFPPALIFMLAFIRYLLHRLSLSSSLDTNTQDALYRGLDILQFYIGSHGLPDTQGAAVSDLMEDIIVSPIFERRPELMPNQSSTVQLYSKIVGVRSHPGRGLQHKLWPALRPLVEFWISHDISYDIDYHCYTALEGIWDILEFGLRHGVPIVYDVFLEKRCLDVSGGHYFHPSLVSVINGYITGLSAPHASIDSQKHLDYLHKPNNLFLACYILAANGWYFPSENLRSNIRALASLRPSDPSWDQCRWKLQDLLHSDGGEFFIKQRKWVQNDDLEGLKDLEPTDIDKAKSNICSALAELDQVLSDSGNMCVRFS